MYLSSNRVWWLEHTKCQTQSSRTASMQRCCFYSSKIWICCHAAHWANSLLRNKLSTWTQRNIQNHIQMYILIYKCSSFTPVSLNLPLTNLQEVNWGWVGVCVSVDSTAHIQINGANKDELTSTRRLFCIRYHYIWQHWYFLVAPTLLSEHNEDALQYVVTNANWMWCYVLNVQTWLSTKLEHPFFCLLVQVWMVDYLFLNTGRTFLKSEILFIKVKRKISN